MARQPISPVDAAWYHMDGPAHPAMVTGVLLTRQPLDFAKVRALYRERLLKFERFRQRVVEHGVAVATPHWEDVADFDIDQHMHHVALPAPHDESALRVLLADAVSTPLDASQPLWQVLVVDGVDGGRRRAQHLAQTHARMDALEHSPEPVAMRVLMEIFGRGPKVLEDLANEVLGSKASVVMTNVAGPRERLYLAVVADARLVPDPETITRQFNREFEALLRAPRPAPAKERHP